MSNWGAAAYYFPGRSFSRSAAAAASEPPLSRLAGGGPQTFWGGAAGADQAPAAPRLDCDARGQTWKKEKGLANRRFAPRQICESDGCDDHRRQPQT
eukprot:5948256-Pyramimonas_sp.AAC.1